jgi:hypothetical protein
MGQTQQLKNETGKDALTHLKDVVDEDHKKRKKIKRDFKNTIEYNIQKKITTN